jgi:hypothetical protein
MVKTMVAPSPVMYNFSGGTSFVDSVLLSVYHDGDHSTQLIIPIQNVALSRRFVVL